MYALFQETPYDGQWPIAYFETEDEAVEALYFKKAHDEKMNPTLLRAEWDWSYFVRAIAPMTQAEFKAPYQFENKVREYIYEGTSLGGDDCFTGRMWQSKSDPNNIAR